MSDEVNEQFGKYLLLRRLPGGMAEVYVARQEFVQGISRTVVIKRLPSNLTTNSDFVQMFLDEVKIASQISSPNVVQIYDFGDVNGIYYLSMEYVDGIDLRSLINSLGKVNRTVPPVITALIAEQICKGLEDIHTKKDERGKLLNIAHRDISPQNIMVSYDGVVKILDFGIAKATERFSETQNGHIKGKFAYMSPEQIEGGKVDGRSDIFSLGIVLWEMLTGKRLFKRESGPATLQAIINEKPPSIKEINPTVPKELEAIVLKALRKKPSQRYQSAAEMQGDIKNFLKSCGEDASTKNLAEFVKGLKSGIPTAVESTVESRSLSRSRSLSASISQFVREKRTTLLLGVVAIVVISALVGLFNVFSPSQLFKESSEEVAVSKPKLSDFAEPVVSEVKPETKAPVVEGKIIEESKKSPESVENPPVKEPKPEQAIAVEQPKKEEPEVEKPSVPQNKKVEEKKTEMAEKAELTLYIDPAGSELWVNGKSYGKVGTQFSFFQLSAGQKLKVRVEKEGYLPFEKNIKLNKGKNELSVSLTFIVQEAFLTVRTNPWGVNVYVDGQNLGTTPVNSAKVNTGAHNIRLVQRDWGIDYSESVEIASNKENLFKKDFTGELGFKVIPDGTVYVDSKMVGEVPMPPVKLSAGAHVVKVVCSSGASLEKSVIVKADTKTILEFNCQK